MPPVVGEVEHRRPRALSAFGGLALTLSEVQSQWRVGIRATWARVSYCEPVLASVSTVADGTRTTAGMQFWTPRGDLGRAAPEVRSGGTLRVC